MSGVMVMTGRRWVLVGAATATVVLLVAVLALGWALGMLPVVAFVLTVQLAGLVVLLRLREQGRVAAPGRVVVVAPAQRVVTVPDDWRPASTAGTPYRWRYLNGAGTDVTQRLLYEDDLWVREAHVVHAESGLVLLKMARHGEAWRIGGGHLRRTLGLHALEFYTPDEALAVAGEMGRLSFVEASD